MGVFCLSFHLNDDGAGQQRKFALMRAVQSVQRRYWDRTDNFVIFETAHTLDFLGSRFKTEIDAKLDLLLLFDVGGSGDAVICGNNTDRDVFSMLPQCRQIG